MFNPFVPKVPKVEAEEVKNAIESSADVVLLDVRTPEEYARGSISGSINLSVDNVKEKIEKLLPEKDKKIYVYCLSGSRSVQAVDTMLKLGYKHVFDMNHGLLAWRVKGYPL